MARKLWLMFLLLILVEVVRAGLSAYLSSTAHEAVSRELDGVLGQWGSWITPWLFDISPSLSRAVGSYFHARTDWGWSRPAAFVYGFPGVVIAVPALVGGLGLAAWNAVRRRREARRAASAGETAGDGAPVDGQRQD